MAGSPWPVLSTCGVQPHLVSLGQREVVYISIRIGRSVRNASKFCFLLGSLRPRARLVQAYQRVPSEAEKTSAIGAIGGSGGSAAIGW